MRPAEPRQLLSSNVNLGTSTYRRTVTFPKGTPPLGPNPLVATGGTISAQVVAALPDGTQSVTFTAQIAHGQGGRLTVTEPISGLSTAFYRKYANDFTYPPRYSKIYSPVRGNIFLRGSSTETPRFTFVSGHAFTGYTVYDWLGAVAASGPILPTDTRITITTPLPCGSYSLFLTGNADQAQYGHVLASTVFGIAPPAIAGTNLPPFAITSRFQYAGNRPILDVSLAGAVQGGGCERIDIKKTAAPDAEIASAILMVQAQTRLYVNGINGRSADPVRGRPLLVNFPGWRNRPGEAGGVTKAVAALSAAGVGFFEGTNEPDASPGAAWVPYQKAFYKAVKAGSANARVVGPAGVDPEHNLDGFIAAGGMQAVDQFSFHAYNAVNGDYSLGETVMGRLHGRLVPSGRQNGLWMTEQGYAPNFGAVTTPQRAAAWTLAQMLVLERWGCPMQQQLWWYRRAAGDWAFPSCMGNVDGSVNASAYLYRRYAEETWSKPFANAYSFGGAGGLLWYANRYDGQGPALGQSVSVFAGRGTRGEVLKLAVTSSSVTGADIPGSLVCADAWGNEVTLPVVRGMITLPPTDLLARYVRHASSILLTPTGLDYGPDLCRAAGALVQTPTNRDKAGLLINGVHENGYDPAFTGHTWGSDSAALLTSGQGSNVNHLKGDTKFPYTITVDLGGNKALSRMILTAPPLWQGLSALLSADISVRPQGGEWRRVGRIRQAAADAEIWRDQLTFATHDDDNTPEQSRWNVKWSPGSARYVRLTVNDVTWGGQGTKRASLYGGQPGARQVTLSEIGLYSR